VRVEGAPAELRRLGADPQRARLLLLGHTHHPLAYASRSGRLPLKRGLRTQMPRDELVLANPGSVGQSRRWSPWGTLLVLDTSRWQLELHAVRYDPRPVRRSLRSRGLPRGSLYRPPFAPRAALRRWRRA
jgi:predicted phosphodiesterase